MTERRQSGSLLRPRYQFKRIEEIDPRKLGLRFLIIDVDNTITERGSAVLSPEVVAFFRQLPAINIQACLLSNVVFGKGRIERVERIARQLGVECVCATGFRCKPHAAPFIAAMKELQVGFDRRGEIGVIGDQLFTDIKGGNKLGMVTILVEPLGKDSVFTAWKRTLERWILR